MKMLDALKERASIRGFRPLPAIRRTRQIQRMDDRARIANREECVRDPMNSLDVLPAKAVGYRGPLGDLTVTRSRRGSRRAALSGFFAFA